MHATLTTASEPARPDRTHAEPARSRADALESAGTFAAQRTPADDAAGPPNPARKVYDAAAQQAARRELVQRAAALGQVGGPVLQARWRWDMRAPPDAVPEDGDWYERRGTYRNVETGESYDPRTRTLDNPDEPFGLQELDDRRHELLMQEIFRGAARSVFVDDRDGRVYDPDLRIESGGDLDEERDLDPAAHRRLMREIEADLEYQEYLDSLEPGEVDEDEDPLGWLDEDAREHVDVNAELDRLDDEERLEAEPESTYDVLASGRYVDQDDRDEDEDDDPEEVRLFHHIGTELAYTFYLSVCTALAMYHPGTGLSFLAHNDSSNRARLATAVQTYFATVRRAADDSDVLGEIRTRLYVGHAARSMSGQSSADVVLDALREAVGDEDEGREFLDNVRLIEGAGQGDIVTVGGGEGPRVAPPVVAGSWELDMAINLIYLERHQTDNGMSVTRMLETERDNASRLVGALDDIRAAVRDLLAAPEEFRKEMENEIVALYNLQLAVARYVE